MRAIYVGSQFNAWEMEGRSGVYTDIHLTKPFRSDEQNVIGDKVVTERVRSDFRKRLKDFEPGMPVDITYDVGSQGKAILVDIVPL